MKVKPYKRPWLCRWGRHKVHPYTLTLGHPAAEVQDYACARCDARMVVVERPRW